MDMIIHGGGGGMRFVGFLIFAAVFAALVGQSVIDGFSWGD